MENVVRTPEKDARINAINKRHRSFRFNPLALLARGEIFMSCMSNTDARTFIIRRLETIMPSYIHFQSYAFILKIPLLIVTRELETSFLNSIKVRRIGGNIKSIKNTFTKDHFDYPFIRNFSNSPPHRDDALRAT